ncbi:ABC transporter substrate-binding protein [Microbacterium marinilacus]|uniref:ABC transporter substrate-binding protein n=1 Tax=Microbacterium marinilacus TaxID=415209 RepID=A0ABP7BHL2_9MICO|nr:ABC transporter substrate-binding protein [Microbacterium marinilacus]MBY0687608.1 ABC transporter substrate-binding protein [Microbacterium marinilacus]
MTTSRTRATAPAVVLLAGLALAGCSTTTPSETSSGPYDTAAYPVTVSSCGQDFAYDQAPSRVVLGNWRTLETLDALGVGESVTGVVLGPDDQGQAPADLPEGVTVVSPDVIPAREPVIEAAPDLFLSFNEAQLVGQGTLSYDDLAGIGANAYVMGAYCAEPSGNQSIETVYTDITNLGAIYDMPTQAEELNQELQDRVAAAKESLNGSTARVAFLKVVGGKVYAIGGYPASAFTEALGLTNEFSDLPTAFAELNTEQALAMDPDIVFVNYVGDEQAAIADLAAALPGLAAVTENRVYGADENLAQGSGVGIVNALEAIAADVETAGR